MVFRTKIRLDNTKVKQEAEDQLSLLGSTVFNVAEYTNKTHESYTDRSLVDKEFVTNAITEYDNDLDVGLTTSSNGLTDDGETIELGGTLSKNTTIDGDSLYSLSIIDLSDFIVTVANDFSATSNGDIDLIAGGTGSSNVNISSINGGINLESIGGLLSLFDNTVKFTDKRTTKIGIEYDADYSADFVDRSLVDKEFVTNAITEYDNDLDVGLTTSSNGLTDDGETVELGGTLTKDTTIDGDEKTHSLIFENFSGGVKYAADYSADFVDRSLVDKEFVSNAITEYDNNLDVGLTTSSNGLTDDGETVELGGTLTKNTTIDGGSFGLVLKNLNGGLKYDNDYSGDFTERSLIDKGYVDAIAVGLKPKTAVLVGTTEDITLSGTQTIDNVSLSEGDRVLVKDQNDGTENGIYVVSSGSWSRSPDFDNIPEGELSMGGIVPVISGDTHGNQIWILTTPDPISLGDDVLEFSIFSKLINILEGDAISIDFGGVNKTINVASSIAGDGLAWNSGVLNVRASSSTIGGAALPVKLGNDDYLFIDSNDINALYDTENGLTVESDGDGLKFLLGGTLTKNTTINGDGKTYSIIFESMDGGVKYAADYSADFVDRSLVDKEFVTNAITEYDNNLDVGLTTSSNGLTDDGETVELGGTLSKNTTIDGTVNLTLSLNKITLVSSSDIELEGDVVLKTTPDTGSVTDDWMLFWNETTQKIRKVDPSDVGYYNNEVNYTTISSNTTLNNDHHVVLVDSTTEITLTLPSTPKQGLLYKIKDSTGDAETNNITIDGNANDIDGDSTALINTDYGALEMVYDGNQWLVLSFNN